MGEKILIVEDDHHLREKIKNVLESYGYKVASVRAFDKVEEVFEETGPDLVLMDIVLPMYDGYYWCRQIRKISNVPVVFISSKDMDMDIVHGMEIGGDDYIVKPFSTEVLLAKIMAILRRSARQEQSHNRLGYGDLQLLEDQSAVSYEDKVIDLTRNEWRILHELVLKKQEIVSRNRLMEVLWDDDQFVNENTLTVNVNRLRQKLISLGLEGAVETKKGLGYIFNLKDLD